MPFILNSFGWTGGGGGGITPVTGNGTATYLPIWTAATVLGDSIVRQNATNTAVLIGSTFIADNSLTRVGIGLVAAMGATLHVKGSGATSATISLLVENSGSLPILSARDDRRVGINTIAPAATLEVRDEANAGIKIVSVGGYEPYIDFYTEAVGSYLYGTIRGANGIAFSPFGVEKFVMGSVGMLFGSGFVTINSTIHNAGSLSETKITTVSVGVHTVLATEYIFNCTGTCTINLPSIIAANIGIGKVYKIYAAEAVTVTVVPNGADTIDGAASATLIGWGVITLRCLSAGNWRVGD